MNKKIRIIGAAVVALVWLGLCGFAWFQPPKAESDSERRPLEQFPELTGESLMEGDFMADFESYTLDQFPMRDTFRKLKAMFHYNVLGQKDNNDIILYDGYAAKMEYPLNETSIRYALAKFQSVYDKYLAGTGSQVYCAVVPDKGYYLPENAGYLTMDYQRLFDLMEEGMPYAQQIDLTDCLALEDYYRTDTHWRQENLLDAAQRVCQSMGVSGPDTQVYTPVRVDKLADRPFYGVYYGQAALPMEPDTLTILESDLLKDCVVTNHETNQTTQVYDIDKMLGKDMYEVYLSGPVSLLTIENPNAATDRELIVFRDSFGSSMVPLLVQDYATVTLVDIRYINSGMLDRFVEFHGQDVLFLYSTLVLNNSSTLK